MLLNNNIYKMFNTDFINIKDNIIIGIDPKSPLFSQLCIYDKLLDFDIPYVIRYETNPGPNTVSGATWVGLSYITRSCITDLIGFEFCVVAA